MRCFYVRSILPWEIIIRLLPFDIQQLDLRLSAVLGSMPVQLCYSGVIFSTAILNKLVPIMKQTA